MGAALATVLFAAVVLVTAVADGVALALVAVLVGLAAVVDGARLLGRLGARPVLPAAVLPVVVLPLLGVGDAAVGWARLGAWYAAAFLLAALLLVVSGRRRTAALGLGGTMAVAALAGLGAVGVVLLAAQPPGPVWLVVVVLLVVAADVPDRAVREAVRRQGRTEPPLGVAASVAAFGGTVFAAAAVGTALLDTISPAAVAVLAAVVFGVGRLAGWLWPSGLARAEPAASGRAAASGAGPAPGSVLAVIGTLLLAAPLAYLIVRAGAA